MINPEDFLIESYPKHPVGGQQVTLTRSGVKITHIPTGTVAIVEHCRSQHNCRAVAMNMILCALTDPDFK